MSLNIHSNNPYFSHNSCWDMSKNNLSLNESAAQSTSSQAEPAIILTRTGNLAFESRPKKEAFTQHSLPREKTAITPRKRNGDDIRTPAPNRKKTKTAKEMPQAGPTVSVAPIDVLYTIPNTAIENLKNSEIQLIDELRSLCLKKMAAIGELSQYHALVISNPAFKAMMLEVDAIRATTFLQIPSLNEVDESIFKIKTEKTPAGKPPITAEYKYNINQSRIFEGYKNRIEELNQAILISRLENVRIEQIASSAKLIKIDTKHFIQQ